MATRPVFVSKASYPYYEQENVEFTFHSGFALSQKQKNIEEIHRAFCGKHPESRIIEISSKSTELIGVHLSAFNVLYKLDGQEVPLESVFQGSKVFEKGGPFHDLYQRGPGESKKDPRIRESGKIIGFDLAGERFRSEPKDFFYNWIYSVSLYSCSDWMDEIRKYDAFTDIEFNPKKSLNCQARTVAILRGLMITEQLSQAMGSPDDFLSIVYHFDSSEPEPRQMTLFD